tara:strand:+ start:424 stop:936 length:513 start_codon:yes stop_codon:yes gene_type:complete
LIITILRKPLDGSVAENTLNHGCGAINIDDTRVSFGDEYKEKGRWPANFILIHKEGCELKGTKKIKEGVGKSDKGGTEREVGLYKDGLKKRAKDHHQGEETIEDWYCVNDCPVKEMDRQSGIKTNTSNYSYKRSNGDFIDKIPDMVEKSHWRTETGGASRFFKQFKDDDQ